MTDCHGVIRVEMAWDGFSPTARVRCACGTWRQAGSFSQYPGEAGAILLVTQRLECGDGPLTAMRQARPFPADPASVQKAAAVLAARGATLRSEAARLAAQADEYETAARRLAA
jgi:hypothetical protein